MNDKNMESRWNEAQDVRDGPMATLHPRGTLDGSTCLTLVSQAQAEVESGAVGLVIDLSDVESVSSAGALGIYVVAALLDGEHFDDLESFAVMRRMRCDIECGKTYAALRLVAYSDKVGEELAAAGLDRLVAMSRSAVGMAA